MAAQDNVHTLQVTEIPKIAQVPEMAATGNGKDQTHGPPKRTAAVVQLTHPELVLIHYLL